MPVYNAGRYVAASIQSILSQTFSDLELIIVDDRSTDDSAEVIASFNDPRIRTVSNEVNSGIVFVAVLDSDDIAHPDRIERQVAFLESHPDHGICGSDYAIIDSTGNRSVTLQVPHDADENRTYLKFNICFCHSTMMVRTSIVREHPYRKGFDIIEDYELAYHASKTWKVGNIKGATTDYRVHGNNISIDKRQKMLQTRMRLDAEVLTDLGIPFSERELLLHSNFINTDMEFFRATAVREELLRWLEKYMDAVSLRKDLVPSVLRRVIAIRWTLICLHNRLPGVLFDRNIRRITGPERLAGFKQWFTMKTSRTFPIF
jgi:glycosyltransferase involved in cell wall biosynthesis